MEGPNFNTKQQNSCTCCTKFAQAAVGQWYFLGGPLSRVSRVRMRRPRAGYSSRHHSYCAKG
eukprot:793519-Rhodomonas_salina.4